MITVRIGTEERQCPVDQNWVNQQIKGRRDAGGTPCVRVSIRSSGIDVALASAGCGGGSGGGRFTWHFSCYPDGFDCRARGLFGGRSFLGG